MHTNRLFSEKTWWYSSFDSGKEIVLCFDKIEKVSILKQWLLFPKNKWKNFPIKRGAYIIFISVEKTKIKVVIIKPAILEGYEGTKNKVRGEEKNINGKKIKKRILPLIFNKVKKWINQPYFLCFSLQLHVCLSGENPFSLCFLQPTTDRYWILFFMIVCFYFMKPLCWNPSAPIHSCCPTILQLLPFQFQSHSPLTGCSVLFCT